MNKLKGLSATKRAEINGIIEVSAEAVYLLGYADGQAAASTVEDQVVEHEGKLLRKVDREARDGDYARFSVEQANLTVDLTAGKLYKVCSYEGRLAFECDLHENIPYFLYGGYGRNPENIEVFEVIGYVDYVDMPVPVPLTANQQRAELIQRAREFVEEHQRDLPGDSDCRDYGNKTCRDLYYKTEFFMKKNKVTAVIHQLRSNSERSLLKSHKHIGRAICSIGDVFNEWIGKAIALAKALQIDIPQEFLDAVQPDEVVVGMVVQYNEKLVKIIPTGQDPEPRWRSKGVAEPGSLVARSSIIIDDTNAQYGESDET